MLRFVLGLPVRQAEHEAVQRRIDFQYATAMELNDPGFHHSMLTDFRDRLTERRSRRPSPRPRAGPPEEGVGVHAGAPVRYGKRIQPVGHPAVGLCCGKRMGNEPRPVPLSRARGRGHRSSWGWMSSGRLREVTGWGSCRRCRNQHRAGSWSMRR
ncbi:transposase [Streptomyces sp. NPDC035033]|uniref:transposase n=1 Tax=Streptomyces sp. NPDC035033 TaxID=3155368 RepID=UPI0033F1F39B